MSPIFQQSQPFYESDDLTRNFGRAKQLVVPVSVITEMSA